MDVYAVVLNWELEMVIEEEAVEGRMTETDVRDSEAGCMAEESMETLVHPTIERMGPAKGEGARRL